VFDGQVVGAWDGSHLIGGGQVAVVDKFTVFGHLIFVVIESTKIYINTIFKNSTKVRSKS
jgi:hypothetical protein